MRDGEEMERRERCRQKEKHLQAALPPPSLFGEQEIMEMYKCKRGRLTDKEEEEREQIGRETERFYWLTVITSSLVEIFLLQSKK